ncbi:hypothetical protein FKM82_030825 [Ascaphus truei]
MSLLRFQKITLKRKMFVSRFVGILGGDRCSPHKNAESSSELKTIQNIGFLLFRSFPHKHLVIQIPFKDNRDSGAPCDGIRGRLTHTGDSYKVIGTAAPPCDGIRGSLTHTGDSYKVIGTAVPPCDGIRGRLTHTGFL